MYCWRCGERNEETYNNCIKCGAVLRAVELNCPTDSISGLIPYKNSAALTSYYCGVFSLIPFFGVILAIVAITMGISGINAYKKNNLIRGYGHSLTGIILGSLVLLGHAVFVFSFIFSQFGF